MDRAYDEAALIAALDRIRDHGEMIEAIAEVERTYDVPMLPHLALTVAELYHRSRQSECAAKLLERTVNAGQGSPRFLMLCAMRSIDAGNLVRSRAMLERVLAAHPLDGLSMEELRAISRVASATGYHDLALRCALIPHARGDRWPGDELVERLRMADHNARHFPRIPVISLGANCQPWLILNRWGFRAAPWSDHSRSPLNLLATTTIGAAMAVETGGRGLTEGLTVRRDELGRPFIFNEDYRITFEHERDMTWITEGFPELHDRYANYADTFATVLAEAPKLFVHLLIGPPDDVFRLIDAVAAIGDARDMQLVIFGDADVTIDQDWITYRRVDQVQSPYLWFHPDDFETSAGIAFETKIARAVWEGAKALARRRQVDPADLSLVI